MPRPDSEPMLRQHLEYFNAKLKWNTDLTIHLSNDPSIYLSIHHAWGFHLHLKLLPKSLHWPVVLDTNLKSYLTLASC